MAAKKKKKKDSRVRCSFRVSESKLRKFQAKARHHEHDVDDLFTAFIHAYENREAAGSGLGLIITVKTKKK